VGILKISGHFPSGNIYAPLSGADSNIGHGFYFGTLLDHLATLSANCH
jgi:hypothetical protein